MRTVVPDTPGGAVVLAMALGDRYRLDFETRDALRGAGLAHTLALSGLHVGFVVLLAGGFSFFCGLLRPSIHLEWPRTKLLVLTAAPLVLAYAWLGGFTPSLVRASVMFFSWGVLLFFNRGRVLLDGLFLALAAILLVSPLSIYDLSLQLSASAVAGIALFLPLVQRLLPKGPSPLLRFVITPPAMLLMVSLSANLGILPLAAHYFGETAVNLLVNVVWLPLLGFAVMPAALLGTIFLALGPLRFLGEGLVLFSSWGMDRMLGLLEGLQQLGLTPMVALPTPGWPVLVGYALLGTGVVAAVVDRSSRGRLVSVLGAGILFLALPFFWTMGGERLLTGPMIRLTVLDVGQAQSVLLEGPAGSRWLIDGGGPGSRRFDLGRAIVSPVASSNRPPVLKGGGNEPSGRRPLSRAAALPRPLSGGGVLFQWENARW